MTRRPTYSPPFSMLTTPTPTPTTPPVGSCERRRRKPDEFVLTRFVVSCCVADALSVEVHVAGAPPGQFQNDDWVRATGKIYPLSQETILDASEITKIDRPKHPYITP